MYTQATVISQSMDSLQDQTATFMHEATEFFVQENVPRFVRGDELLNHVDKVAGY
jgi:hypothetical protein